VSGNPPLGREQLRSYSKHRKMKMIYVRPATGSDAPIMKKLLLKARSDAMPYLPIHYI
tara:strand:- start:4983 stop:5156 length:174 start_codon:yes stop_codon:yes gene_type:complete